MSIDTQIMSLQSGDILIARVDTGKMPAQKAWRYMQVHKKVLRELIPNKKIRILVVSKNNISFDIIRPEV
ncbi:MAG: hypothetical protein QXN55_01275 [Candidatus Nitrosotenuis sp.]